ncbi:MAG: hypothetical protein F4X36_04865 [Gammaproteobacteria bacterium]|nr:hypothetical protein [Gammaproteobacteria bacterium]
MREEIERILEMQERGELTREEAAARIEALARDAAGARERSRPSFEDLERSIGNLGREFGNVLARASKGIGEALRPESWVNETNPATFSKAEPPGGDDFRCEGNSLNLARVTRMRLLESTFADNELHAAGIERFDCDGSVFARNALRASSIERFELEDGTVTDNQCNASRLAAWRLSSASVERCRLNATQATDVALSGSTIREARWNAVQLSGMTLDDDTALDGLALNGVAGRDWTFHDTKLIDSSVSGLRIVGLTCRSTRLAHCTLRHGDWVRGIDPRERFALRNVRMEHTVLEHCEFVDCRLDDTTFEHVEVSGLVFRDVDFSGMTLKSSEELAELASTGRESD